MGPLTSSRASHLFLYVYDFERMVTFYRDVLGIPVYYFEAGQFAFLRPGGDDALGIALYPGRETPITEKSHWFVVFEVSELDETIRQLQENGVDVGDIQPETFGRYIQFNDPEGNLIEVHEAKK